MADSSNKIKVAIIGAGGKMGQIAEKALSMLSTHTVVAKVGREDNLELVLQKTAPDIAIELTSHVSVLANTQTIIKNNVHPVIGSSGLLAAQIEELKILCHKKALGGLIMPNFSLGMAFMNKVARELEPYFDDFSIIEFHHRQKKDKPSGTAGYTAGILSVPEVEIASIRSNGFLAKQQLYINSLDERIIIDHESFNRDSFIPGIQLSLKMVMDLRELVVGLENIL